jgi:4-amino-4-deoxy-L-arabinose transferase-like glycosyltransferase
MFNKCLKFVKKNKAILLVFTIFIFELFLRFYQIEQRNPFGYDQVDNAWAAQKIIVHHEFPLVGMVAKGNSNIYIGPAYYYLISISYWITNLNPIASGIMAGVTSIFTFWTIYFVTKKLFSQGVAIIAVVLNTFLLSAINFDRVQWPVNLIPGISLIIFYLLYKITQGDVKKIIPLALLVGFSFSVHFTSIFFPIIIVLALPFFPKNRDVWGNIFWGLVLFLICLVPNVIYQLQQKSSGSTFGTYFNSYFHGFHLRRVIQLAGDGLIQFDPYLFVDKLFKFKFIALPLFFLVYLYKSVSRKRLIFCYLVALWFIVPWFALSTYSGEISDYYFSFNRFIALMIISYFFAKIWMIRNIIPKIIVGIILIIVVYSNLTTFLLSNSSGLAEKKEAVLTKIGKGEEIKFQWGVPESYLYYYFLRQKGITVY